MAAAPLTNGAAMLVPSSSSSAPPRMGQGQKEFDDEVWDSDHARSATVEGTDAFAIFRGVGRKRGRAERGLTLFARIRLEKGSDPLSRPLLRSPSFSSYVSRMRTNDWIGVMGLLGAFGIALAAQTPAGGGQPAAGAQPPRPR
jgi:hypothetical protein